MYQYHDPHAWERHLTGYESSNPNFGTENSLSLPYGHQALSRSPTIQSQSLAKLPEDVNEKLKAISTKYMKSRQSGANEAIEKAQALKSENLRKEGLKRSLDNILDEAETTERDALEVQRQELHDLVDSVSADEAEVVVSAWKDIFSGIRAFLQKAKQALFAALKGIMLLIAMAWEGLKKAAQVVKGFFVSAWAVIKDLFGSCDGSEE